jgi:hypothetical protein
MWPATTPAPYSILYHLPTGPGTSGIKQSAGKVRFSSSGEQTLSNWPENLWTWHYCRTGGAGETCYEAAGAVDSSGQCSGIREMRVFRIEEEVLPAISSIPVWYVR